MLRNLATLTMTFTALAALSGCSDAIIGDWEARDSCGQEELTVEDDGKGDGFVYASNCTQCRFDFDWEEDGDDRYEADVSFESGCGCAVDGATRGKATCKMNDDGDEMDCDLTLGACVMGDTTWEKQD